MLGRRAGALMNAITKHGQMLNGCQRGLVGKGRWAQEWSPPVGNAQPGMRDGMDMTVEAESSRSSVSLGTSYCVL